MASAFPDALIPSPFNWMKHLNELGINPMKYFGVPPNSPLPPPPGINWMKHLNELGVKYYIVGATDKKTAEFLSGQVGMGRECRGGGYELLSG